MRLPHSTIPFHFPVFPLPRSNLIRSYWKTLTHEINVISWLVARFAIVANFLQIILKLMYCLEGSLLWQKKHWKSLLFGKKQPVIAEKQTFFSKTLKLSQVFAQLSIWACKCISIWVGLFAGFTIAASCARAAPGSPEGKQAFSKSNCQIQTPSLSQRSQSLIKLLLKNSFSTIFQGPEPGEAPFHFSKVGLFAGFTIAASCARAAPGSPEGKQAFSKSNCQIQTPSLSQRSQSLIKLLLKNSFSTIFQGPEPGEAPFHFSKVGLFAGFTIAASCARAAPGSPEGKQAFSKSNCQIQTPSLSQRSQSLIKLLLKNSFSTIFQGPEPGEAPFHFSKVGLFAGFTIAASCARAAPGSPEGKQAFSKSNCQIQTPSLSQRSQSLIKLLLKNSFSTIFQGPEPGEAPFHFSKVGLFAGFTIAASCARAAPGSPEGKQAFSKSNCQIQTPSLSQRSQSLIKPLQWPSSLRSWSVPPWTMVSMRIWHGRNVGTSSGLHLGGGGD